MNCEQKQRDYCIDALKMLLIVLVIYGHIPLLDGFIHDGLSIECDTPTMVTVKGIYAFHMPLFVMISGYFSKRRMIGEQLCKSANLLKLFLIFHCLDLFLNWCYSGTTPGWHEMIYPSFALWYLLCLFYWRIMICFVPKHWSRKTIVRSSVAIALAIGFVPIHGELGFHRFFSFMPYFLVGHYYGATLLEKAQQIAHKITPPILLLLIILTIVTIVGVSFNPRWLDVIISPFSDIKDLPLRLMYIAYSSLLCFAIVILLKYKNVWSHNLISSLGKDTLFFYLYHPYVLYTLLFAYNQFSHEISFLVSVLITLLAVIILTLLRKFKLLHYILK